ncbi:MAG TPA: FHA domain-containing protein [Candidatus Acidoferrum sp.]|nr:FHA domain-containing protein [Candidatus Acidoferrum sp.]
MEEKRKILDLLFPKAVLKALTAEARSAVPNGVQVNGLVVIHEFPFRIGRESRTTVVNDRLHRLERPVAPGTKLNNDLYLLDTGDLLQISREHFLIEKTDKGYLVADRGSKCGIAVNGKRIGANAGIMTAPLQDGDVIAIGTSQSHYLYTFITDFDNSHW